MISLSPRLISQIVFLLKAWICLRKGCVQTARNNFATRLHQLLIIFDVVIVWINISEYVNIKGQHTSRFLIFLAWLFILVHEVVPHHHHFEILHSAWEKSTCDSSTQENNNEKTGFHCHTFNIHVSEKTNSNSLINSFSKPFDFDFPGIKEYPGLPPIKKFITTIYGYNAIFSKQILFSFLSLIAPPEVH